jgi:hypothetical protein
MAGQIRESLYSEYVFELIGGMKNGVHRIVATRPLHPVPAPAFGQ